MGGSPKSCSLVRRRASAQSELLSSNQSCRLILWLSVFHPAAHERRLPGPRIFTWLISDIYFRPCNRLRVCRMVEFQSHTMAAASPEAIVLKDNMHKGPEHASHVSQRRT